MAFKHFEVGDVVEYELFVKGNRRLLIVTEKLEEVKNGRPGFFGYIPSEHGKKPDECSYWGYSYDVVRVWRKT